MLLILIYIIKCTNTKSSDLVDKFLDKLKVLGPNALGAVDEQNQVDVG